MPIWLKISIMCHMANVPELPRYTKAEGECIDRMHACVDAGGSFDGCKFEEVAMHDEEETQK